jgi:transcription initiation factor IIE alpha subunit
MVVRCNKGCNKDFEHPGFKEKKLPNMIRAVYFECPLCGEEYISYYTDPLIRVKQTRIRNLWGSQKKIKEIEKLQGEIKVLMNNLKGKVEGNE